MSEWLQYRGYLGSVRYSDEDQTLHGRLEFIRALVTYEGEDVTSLTKAFREAVDDYLDLCNEYGRTPEVPLKGSFNVRPGRDLHRRAMVYARREGMSLNAVVTQALQRMLADRGGLPALDAALEGEASSRRGRSDDGVVEA